MWWWFLLIQGILAIPYCDLTQDQFRSHFSSDHVFVTDFRDRISAFVSQHVDPATYTPFQTGVGVTGMTKRTISVMLRTNGYNPLPVSFGMTVPNPSTQYDLERWAVNAFAVLEGSTLTQITFGGTLASTLSEQLRISRITQSLGASAGIHEGSYVIIELESFTFFSSETWKIKINHQIETGLSMTGTLWSRPSSCSDASCWVSRGNCAVRGTFDVSSAASPFSAVAPFSTRFSLTVPVVLGYNTLNDVFPPWGRVFCVYFSRPVTRCGTPGPLPGGSIQFTNHKTALGNTINWKIGLNLDTNTATKFYQPVLLSEMGSTHWCISESGTTGTIDPFDVPGQTDPYRNIPGLFGYQIQAGTICSSESPSVQARVGPYRGDVLNGASAQIGTGSTSNIHRSFQRERHTPTGVFTGLSYLMLNRTAMLYPSDGFTMKGLFADRGVPINDTLSIQTVMPPFRTQGHYVSSVRTNQTVLGIDIRYTDVVLATIVLSEKLTFATCTYGITNPIVPDGAFQSYSPIRWIVPVTFYKIELVWARFFRTDQSAIFEGHTIQVLSDGDLYLPASIKLSLFRVFRRRPGMFITDTPDPSDEMTIVDCNFCQGDYRSNRAERLLELQNTVKLADEYCVYLDSETSNRVTRYAVFCNSIDVIPVFTVVSIIRVDLFTYSVAFSNALDLVRVYPSDIVFTCPSGTISSYVTEIASPSRVQIKVIAGACTSTKWIYNVTGRSAISSINARLESQVINLEDGVPRTDPYRVIARSDGKIFVSFPVAITSFESERFSLYFTCSTGGSDSALSARISDRDPNTLEVTHARCSSYLDESLSVRVRLTSFNVLLADGSRSSDWEGDAIILRIPEISRVNCSQFSTLIEMTTSRWNLTSSNMTMVCLRRNSTAVVVQATARLIEITNNPLSYGDNCTILFDLDLGYSNVFSYSTALSRVCIPSYALFPVVGTYYTGLTQELALEFATLGQIIPESVNATAFRLSCGNDSVADLDFIQVTDGTTVLLSVAGNCPETSSYSIQLEEGAFQTTTSDSVNYTLTVSVDAKIPIEVTHKECSITSSFFRPNRSQTRFYISGEWDLESFTPLDPCDIESEDESESYFSVTVDMYKYLTCSARLVLKSVGPKYWSYTVVFGACEQWPSKSGLLFKYLFAENQNPDLSESQIRQITHANDQGGKGLGTMDWSSDVIRYKSDSIGIELFGYSDIPNSGGLRALNAISRGTAAQFVKGSRLNPTGSYTFAMWARYKRVNTTLPDQGTRLAGFTLGSIPSQTSRRREWSCTVTYNPSLSLSQERVNEICRDQEVAQFGYIESPICPFDYDSKYFSLGMSVTGHAGNGSLIGLFIQPSARMTRAASSGYCSCAQVQPTAFRQDTFLSPNEFNGAWPPGRRLGGVFDADSPGEAETPVVLMVAAMNAGPDGLNTRGDIYYYSAREGKKKFMPSRHETLPNYDSSNCSGITYQIFGPCTAFYTSEDGPTSYCAVGSEQGSSRFVLFPSPQIGFARHLGEIYSIEMYNRALSEAEIDDLWEIGLPNSKPISMGPAQYAVPENQTFNVMDAIQTYDFDIDDLGRNQTLRFASLRLRNIQDPLVLDYGLIRSRGTLSEGVFTPFECTFGDPYAIIAYSLTDGIVTTPEYQLTVVVTHVNHPPVARDISKKVTLYTNTTVKLEASDCDVDASDGIRSFTLLAAPIHGRVRFAGNGSIVTVFPNRLSGDSFVYEAQTSSRVRDHDDVFEYDQLTFQVFDRLGASSEIKTVRFNISNHVQPGIPANLTLSEDLNGSTPITVGSDSLGSVRYYLSGLPLFGTMFLDDRRVTNEDMPLLINGTLEYLSCNHCWGDDRFFYFAESVANNRRSFIQQQNITVAEVNDPPVMSSLEEEIFADANTLHRFVYPVPIILEDPDPDDSLYSRLKIDCSYSVVVGFDPAIWEEARLVSPPESNYHTVVRGDVYAMNPRFEAVSVYKKYAVQALRNLSFACGLEGFHDVTVTIQDRDGKTSSYKMNINCNPDPTDPNNQPIPGFGESATATAVTLVWVFLFVCCGGLCWTRVCWPRLRPGAKSSLVKLRAWSRKSHNGQVVVHPPSTTSWWDVAGISRAQGNGYHQLIDSEERF